MVLDVADGVEDAIAIVEGIGCTTTGALGVTADVVG
jgi:hypothetical protein